MIWKLIMKDFFNILLMKSLFIYEYFFTVHDSWENPMSWWRPWDETEKLQKNWNKWNFFG